MLPLTETRPKPMQMVLGKNLLERKLEALPEAIKEVIIVIGYQGEQIRDFFGNQWRSKSIRYIVQTELNGTAGALWAARDLLHERFLVLMGDDLYAKEDIARMCAYPWAVCVAEVNEKEVGGEMLANPDGTFRGINEARHYVAHGLMNTGMFMLSRELFQYDPVPIPGVPSEFGLPHTLALLATKTPVAILRATKWMQVTTPDDLKRAESFLKITNGDDDRQEFREAVNYRTG